MGPNQNIPPRATPFTFILCRRPKLMAKANKKSSNTIKRVLKAFCSKSGQTLIAQSKKSSTQKTTKQKEITKFLIFYISKGVYPWGNTQGFQSFIRSKPSKTSIHYRQPPEKLAEWKTKFLNIAGRATLAKGTLSNIPSHSMQYIKLPKQINKKIYQIQRNFIWGTTDSKRKLHLINWETLMNSKSEGGLGIQNVNFKNKALLAKLVWKTITSEYCLRARELKGKYLKHPENHSNPLRTRPEHGKIWKSIALGWKIYEQQLKWSLGSRENISIQYDRWISNNKTLRETIHSLLQKPDEDHMVQHILDDIGQW